MPFASQSPEPYATREILRFIDIVETMRRTFLEALQTSDRKLLAKLAALDGRPQALRAELVPRQRGNDSRAPPLPSTDDDGGENGRREGH